MLPAFLALIGCQLIGEALRGILDVPIPGPVIGMFLLAAILALRAHRGVATAVPKSLDTVAETLIRYLGLLFVPAGVGIIAEAGLLRQEWLPILAGLVGSTVLSIAVTGLVMHWTAGSPRHNEKAAAAARQPAE